MALDSPYYLAVGSLVIEDGTDAAPYHPVGIWLPAPAPDGVGGHVPAVRRFRVKVTGTSTATLTANTAALQQACVRGETLYFRASGSGDILSCRIRKASVVEDEVDLLGALSFERYVTVTLTTDPHWLAPWSAWTNAVNMPDYSVAIPAVGGEDDALLSVRAVFDYAVTGIFLATRPIEPGYDDYDYYGGAPLTSGTLSASPVALAGTSSVSAPANRGRFLPLVSVKFSAAGTASIGSRINTTGVNYAATRYVDSPRVTVTANTDFATIELPPVSLPSYGLPTDDLATGFTTRHDLVLTNTGGGTAQLARIIRLPLDYGAVRVDAAFDKGHGVLYDGDTDLAYWADADGIGVAHSSATTIRPLRAAADATTRLIMAYTIAGAGTRVTLQYRIRKRFLTATG